MNIKSLADLNSVPHLKEFEYYDLIETHIRNGDHEECIIRSFNSRQILTDYVLDLMNPETADFYSLELFIEEHYNK